MPPPRPSWALVLLMSSVVAALCIGVVKAKTGVSTSSLEEDVLEGRVPRSLLCAWRCFAAAFFWHRVVVVLTQTTMDLPLSYLRGSKFAKKSDVLVVRGKLRLVTFTMQTWILQGIYFSLAAAASLGMSGVPLGLTHVLFEVTWSIAHLVTTVTTYVLIPAAVKVRGDEKPLSILERDQLILHNANVLFANVDCAVNNMRLVQAHCSYAGLWCCVYVAFIWSWGSYAGYVPYFFIDYSLPFFTVAALHLGLLVVGLAFFTFGVFLTTASKDLPLGLAAAAHGLLVASSSASVALGSLEKRRRVLLKVMSAVRPGRG
eukprot:CAMPEP_0118894174 /NCGR_PEP_ID=MMETSP1166-20130328/3070_1 /TAXON_ID=1104430 /ORGANISM="Chrysoreinhardia sp, Strain CCMP3193" /LENGTH=315 /DNA_ID=CAMNT_0006833061 /DNA_START=202 /DNA_END=1150 /DNA_ORIENTATION=-